MGVKQFLLINVKKELLERFGNLTNGIILILNIIQIRKKTTSQLHLKTILDRTSSLGIRYLQSEHLVLYLLF